MKRHTKAELGIGTRGECVEFVHAAFRTFPNRMAPVVRHGDGGRELLMMRWGFPPPNIPGQKPRNPYLTNVRNTDSRYWQTYLKKTEHRCLVPATSFAEPDNNQGQKSVLSEVRDT